MRTIPRTVTNPASSSRPSITGYGGAEASAQPSIGLLVGPGSRAGRHRLRAGDWLRSTGISRGNCVPGRDKKKLSKADGAPAAGGHLPLRQDLDGQVLCRIPTSVENIALCRRSRDYLPVHRKWQMGRLASEGILCRSECPSSVADPKLGGTPGIAANGDHIGI